MTELTVMNFNSIAVIDSRQIAEAVGKAHKKLLRDIRTYCDYLGESKIGFTDSTETNFGLSDSTETNFGLSDSNERNFAPVDESKNGLVGKSKYCDYLTESKNGFSDSTELKIELSDSNELTFEPVDESKNGFSDFTELNFQPSDSNEGKISHVDFFIESTYTDPTGRTLPCYLCTKKGCELIAHKLTGKKGVIFTALYINAFHKMKDYSLTDCKLSVNSNEKTLNKDNFRIINKKGDYLMNEEFEKIKPFLLDYVNEITKPSKNGGKNQYICPLCGSGTGSKQSGAFTVYPDTSSYHCFACDANGDIFTLYGEINNITDFRTIADELKSKYNISFSQPIRQKKQPAKPVEPKAEKDYTKFFVMAEQYLHETDYLTQRGISIDTQRKFHCGYVANYQYNQNYQSTPAVIIPTSNTSFMWRSTTENIKQKRGTARILNADALNAPYCFVVEGEIDCMSVTECGFACIGLGSTSNIRKIFDYDTSETVLIIALDNDKAGSKATIELEKLCKEHRTPYITAPNDLWGNCKDANDLLIRDRQMLIRNLQALSERALNLDKNKWQSEHAISEISKKMHTLDDTGNAQRMYDLCGDVMRYCYTDRRWLCYQDGKWQYDAKGGVFVWADKVLENMKSELKLWTEYQNGEMLPDYQKHMKKTRSNNSKKAMVKEMEHLVSVSPAELDSDKFLVNSCNGVLNLNDFSIKPHKPDFLMTRMLGTSMPENPKNPEKWITFLNQIFNNDKELIRYIQKALGYSLSGDTSEQCAFFLYGTGRNGKSTFLEVFRKIMGDYATNIQPESIMIKANTNNANSDIARLKGARFVTSVEPNEGMRLNEGLIKQLTGDDMITARKLYGDEFEFRPEFKLWMATNHKPTIHGTDLGIWRRIHIIPFSVTIPEQAVDKKLSHKLEEELPDILAWAVDGYKLWKYEGLRKPKVIADAVEEYRNEMDVISAFLASDYVVQGGEVKAQALYAVYCQWCSESNEYKMPSRKFSLEMTKRYNKIHKKTGWFYQEVSLDNISIG